MAAARLTEKGQIVIPAEIGARYGLTPTDPVDGFGLIEVPSKGKARHLEAFDAAAQGPARPARKALR